MNTFPKNEIKEVNEMLHKLLGNRWSKLNIYGKEIMFPGEGFLGRQVNDNSIKSFEKKETLVLLKKCSDSCYLDIYRFLSFYYPRWIAYNVIKESDDHYAEYSANNELLIALTSIIDRIANKIYKKSSIDKQTNILKGNNYVGSTKKFVYFIDNNLDKDDTQKIFKGAKIYKKKEKGSISSLKEFAKYIYKIRSLIVHEAELGGIYPYNVSFDFDGNKIDNMTFMLTPNVFRKLLWKAIFNHLELKIIF